MQSAFKSQSLSLPSLVPLPGGEQRRLLRRLEHNAKAREAAARIEGQLSTKRDATKQQNLREHGAFLMEMRRDQQERFERWKQKTQGNPLAGDQWVEDQQAYEANQRKIKQERQQQRRAERQQRGAYNAVFAKAVAEVDEAGLLRAERRAAIENEQQLKAMHDVEKTCARQAKVLQLRQERELERQALQLQRTLSAPSL
mmetsp:Transcript_73013/g.144741  ORF Transcript_73013/g.144741 Transcript_73013/m.144741 type:complete len:199 (+) Transcript_73013:46-642(+)